MLNPIHKKLCKMGKIDKNEIESLKKILKKHAHNITENIRIIIANNLTYD